MVSCYECKHHQTFKTTKNELHICMMGGYVMEDTNLMLYGECPIYEHMDGNNSGE